MLLDKGALVNHQGNVSAFPDQNNVFYCHVMRGYPYISPPLMNYARSGVLLCMREIHYNENIING